MNKYKMIARLKREGYEIVGMLIVCCISLLIRSFVGNICITEGTSMMPTIENHQIVCVSKIYKELNKRDIIVFKAEVYGKSENLMKRIIAGPEDTIQIIDGEVYVNDQLVKEDFEKMDYSGIGVIKIHLGPDEYFVLGDNRNNSLDSRSLEVGIVKKKQILGKCLFIDGIS